ncbi:PAS domain S-box protein [Actinoplanes sp. KI2]|uniref:PAS domain-containing hybrid sensor histidine kinase/response regulator n=1 Tax=Actinoplanes sp. KI2 TaxID=2983315 RepID=UPI0021D5BC4B|nr:PAS domain S-box protein [Actinoplanes sp. KI2]MCU7722438.1 PAS domain S-box protein [Actinoplanes sp. KI2]
MSSSPDAGDRAAPRFLTRVMGSLAAALGVFLLAFGAVAAGLSLILLGGGAVALADRHRRYARRVVPIAAVVIVAMTGDLILPLTGRGGAAGAFLLLAAAQLLLLGDRHWTAAGQAAAIGGGMIGLLAIYGLVVPASGPVGTPADRALGLTAALGIVAVAVAALPAPAGTGLIWVLADHTESARLTRRTLVAALVALPLTARLITAGRYGPQLEAALLVVANAGIIVVVGLVTGSRAARMERAGAAARAAPADTGPQRDPAAFSIKGPDGETGEMTPARAAAEAQAQSYAQLAGIVLASNDAIVSKTLDGTILTWNPGARRLYGYTAEEMIGRDVTVILPPDRPDEEKRLLARVRAGELIKHHETRRVRRDGTTIYVSLSMAPIRDPDDMIVGASTISHDITAEVEAERRLRFEREQFQTIMTAASDPFVSMDHNGLITEWNRQAEQAFGWSRQQVLGRHVVDTVVPRRYAAALDRVLEGRWTWLLDRPIEMDAVRADGTEFPIELTMWRIRRDGPSTFHAFARDISARRQTEQALAQARDQAVETARLKSQFLASMSHEIRTPMNGVIGLSGLLLGTELSETQRRYAHGINSAGVALLAVINDVLNFSKLEAGKVPLERADFEIWRLLDEVVGLVAHASGAKELTVSPHCHPDLAGPVSGDAGKLRQVLLNLIGNAVKFTGDGGAVTITAGPAEGDFPPGSVPVRFEVSDTGIGIDPDQQARLFEPFVQADAGTTRRFGGTGLGLAISQELVGMLGGEIGLTSAAGQGSTFWFTAALWPAVADADSPHRHALGELRVLLMAGADTAVIAEQLETWVAGTTAAADETAAVGALTAAAEAGRPFDVAVVDDPALVPMIVADPALPAPKLVLIGGGTGRSAGFHAVLSRPVRRSELLDALAGLFTAPADERAARAARSPAGHGRVLLVEDNEINQTVASGILANLGFTTDVAGNGREAVEKAAGRDYRAIFMDCLMPEMDGYEATAAIRRAEGTGRHVPIIAMTAGALPEDRERCLAAGMDDHLTKPLMPATVGAALERWVQVPDVRREIRERLDMLGGAGGPLGPAELSGLLRKLSAHAPGHVEEIHQAVAMDDPARLRDQAHQLKGVAANLGARELAAVCERLEQAARDSDLDAAIEPLAELRPRTREMLAAVEEILSGLDPARTAESDPAAPPGGRGTGATSDGDRVVRPGPG